MVENISSYKIIGLMAETSKGSRMAIAAHVQINLSQLLENLGRADVSPVPLLGSYNMADIEFENLSLQEAEAKLLRASERMTPQGA